MISHSSYPKTSRFQNSFLDAFIEGEDRDGWLEGPNRKILAVSLVLWQGNPGINSPLSRSKPSGEARILEYSSRGGTPSRFTTGVFEQDTEIAGHSMAGLTLSSR